MTVRRIARRLAARISRAGGSALAATLPLTLAGALVVAPADVRATDSAPPDVRAMVEALASDDLAGRGAGTEGLDEARDLVRGWFEAAGLEPGFEKEWLQEVPGPHGAVLFNVVGRLAGRGDEAVVIGAHYDGLGIGAAGSEHEGEIHNGADDNASGVAALVRIAETLAGEEDLERSLIFVAFSGEETGLLGSEHFVADPPVALEKIVAMVNLDTIGGLENDKLIVFGTATADEFPGLLSGVNHAFRFDLAMSREGAGASDHTPFFAKGVPVLHFFTGARATYHRPGDDVETVSFDGVERIADYVTEVALWLATTDRAPTFRPVGAERLEASPPGGGETKRRRVSFGSIPDFSKESGGILLSGVMPGGAAEAAGLTAGDLIVEIDGATIDDIYDFQGVLSEHDPGDELGVVYVRDGERREGKVTLKERK
jgi:hypothetical protein